MPTAQSTHGRTGYRFAAILAVALLAIGAIVFGVAIGTADTSELGNETVNVSADSNPLEISVSFADDLNSSDNTVEATFYNESEYETEGSNATEIHNLSITGTSGGDTTEDVDFNSTGGLDLNTEYRLVLTGDAENVASVEIGGLIGGPVVIGEDAMPGFGLGVALAALALVTAIVAASRRGGGGA